MVGWLLCALRLHVKDADSAILGPDSVWIRCERCGRWLRLRIS